MKFAVIGATGKTGGPLVDLLLDRGNEVRVLVRDPAKLGDVRNRVRVVVGSSTDPAALSNLIAGTDAVVS
ncbi:MAG: NAD(P)H-binding protein, partial [Candidatus Nanopelagicales bacterium]